MIKDKDFKERTKQFALKIIRLVASLPRMGEADIIGNPIVQNRKPNLEQKTVLLSRKQMNHCSGWNC